MTRLLIALVLSAAAAGAQTGPKVADSVPDLLRVHLRSETFTPLTSVAALPEPVKAELSHLFGTKALELAEPGAPFQATDVVVTPRLPWRRLISAGCAADHCLVHYERGGIAHVHQVLVLARDGDRTRFVWGGVAGPLGGVHAVRDALAAGKVQGLSSGW